MSIEKFACFDVSIENHIAHICLNRPEKRNSMIPEFWDQLPELSLILMTTPERVSL